MSQPLTTPQPQVAQLELKFPGPLTTTEMVETLNDLLTFDVRLNYLHKHVWVKEKNTFYFLSSGTGEQLDDWQKLSAKVKIELYNPDQTYEIGETVYISGKIYAAKTDVPKFTSPLDYEEYWLVISGETETYRYLFENTSIVRIFTEIRNPRFEIILGDVVMENGIPKLNPITKLIEFENVEFVDAFVKLVEEEPTDAGIAYDIYFYENSELINKTGAINIK